MVNGSTTTAARGRCYAVRQAANLPLQCVARQLLRPPKSSAGRPCVRAGLTCSAAVVVVPLQVVAACTSSASTKRVNGFHSYKKTELIAEISVNCLSSITSVVAAAN